MGATRSIDALIVAQGLRVLSSYHMPEIFEQINTLPQLS